MSQEIYAVLIAGWLARYNDLFDTYGKSLADRPHIFDDFEAALSDIPLVQLAWAFDQWRRLGKRFPTPADIRGELVKQQDIFDQYESEKAWEFVRWVCEMFWRGPDLGVVPLGIGPETQLSARWKERTVTSEFKDGFLVTPRTFTTREDYAIRSVGGLQRIAAPADGKEFDFVRRDFLKAHRYYSETQGLLASTREEARAMIGKLKDAMS